MSFEDGPRVASCFPIYNTETKRLRKRWRIEISIFRHAHRLGIDFIDFARLLLVHSRGDEVSIASVTEIARTGSKLP